MKIQLKTRMIFPMLLSASFAFSACKNTTNTSSEMQTKPTENSKVENQPNQAGDVAFLDENGKTVSLSSLRGKVVFINFWAMFGVRLAG